MRKIGIIAVLCLISLVMVSPVLSQESKTETGAVIIGLESSLEDVRVGPARIISSELYGDTAKTTILFDGGHWCWGSGMLAAPYAAIASESMKGYINITFMYDGAGNFIGIKLEP